MKGLLVGLLEDRSHDVVEAVFDRLVPASLAWTPLTSPALLQDLLSRILATLSQYAPLRPAICSGPPPCPTSAVPPLVRQSGG